MKRLILELLLLVCTLSVAAQERTITGTVTDPEGLPLGGATVVAVGTKVATTTNQIGVFTLRLPKDATTVEVSFIGFTTQRVVIKPGKAVNVQMEEDQVMLDEVVAIGYGTTKRGNLSGSVTTVDSESLENRDPANVATALQGVSGLEVRTTSGAPGSAVSITVRGAASLNASSDPLLVVDGIPVDDLESLNPSDIQSIEVLKDASSTAIYGSRGSNGVILITTKMPTKEQKTQVQLKVSFALQQLERQLDILSPAEWIEFRTRFNDARYVERFGAQGATAADDYRTRLQYSSNVTYVNDPRWTMPNYGGLQLIDWQDTFFRIAPTQNYQLSISGGTAKNSYRVSVGYLDQDGIAIHTNYRKLTMQARFDTTILNDQLKLGINIRPTVGKTTGGRVDGKDHTAHRAIAMTPIAEPEAGIYTGAEPYARYAWASSAISPVAYMEQVTTTNENITVATSMSLEYSPIRDLKITATGSYTFGSSEGSSFIPSSVLSLWASENEGYQTSGKRSNSRSNNYLFQTVGNYNKDFNAHTLNAMAGFSVESSDGTSSTLSATQFPNNSLQGFNLNDEVITAATAAYANPTRLASFFGRLQYEYDNRYVLQTSLRNDGSSRLGRNNRWGLFPAVSAAYRISNESFFPKDFVISQLKLRGSWGVNGNCRISNTAALALLNSANYSSGGALVNGYAPSAIENSRLGWERTTSWNVALDMSLFKNRISMTAEFYKKTTNDLLYQVSVPATMGFSKAWGNIGSISNTGMELELISRNITKKNFKWSTTFNLSYNKGKVVSLGDDNSTVFTGYSNTQVLMVGQPIGAYYMYDAVGVYQFKEDLQKYPVMKGSVLGDVRYRDANDDGVINDDDRTLVGKPAPDFTYGLTNTFKYKNFDISMVITAQTGGMIYSTLGRAIDRPGMGASINVLSRWKNMWVSEEEPGDGKTPGINNSNTGSLYDTRWLYSTDFLKIKNLTVGYRLKTKKKSPIKDPRVTLSVENLWMWDKYTGGFSPEGSNGGRTAAYDYGTYPLARTFTISCSATF